MAAAEEGGSEVPSLENTDPSLICNINIGVLGHIDSGKTSLVRALSQARPINFMSVFIST